MKLMLLYLLLPFTLFLSLWSSPPVPYSGKIDIRGVNYFGEAQFSFSLHDGNGTTHWRNGSQQGDTIKVSIHNGRYSVLLGGQGMNSLPPELFLNHDKLYLKVEFDNGDGEGLRHLAPDQLITATPRALVAEWAKMAKLAEGVSAGSITRDMLSQQVLTQLDANGSSASIGPITRDMLPTSVLNDLNKTIVITREMLPQDVLADLNKTISKSMLGSDVLTELDQSIKAITRDMLPASVLTDLNRTITKSMLSIDVLADLNNSIGNGSITLGMLSSEVVTALKPAITRNPQSIESVEGVRGVLEVDSTGGNVSYQWKKNGVNVSGATSRVLEISDLNASQHEGNYTVVVSNAFGSVISSVAEINLNGSLTEGLVGLWKFDETNGTIAYDSSGNGNDGNLTNSPSWTSGKIGGALSFDGVDDRVKIPHTILDQKLAFTVSLWFNMTLGSDSSYHAFITAANSSDANAFTFEKRPDHNMMIRDMGETSSSPAKTSDFWTSTWKHVTLTKSSLGIVFYLSGEELYSRNYSTATTSVDANGLWIGPDQDSVGGGWQSGQSVKGVLDDFRIYDRALSPFEVRALHELGEQPVGSVIIGSGMVVNGEVADGAVTAAKIAEGSVSKSALDATILKYLKPEITSQPQAQTFISDSNASFSVTAEGKYLTYQWKKDDVDLVGETNNTLFITDANATNHDGNYSVVVSNDFGSLESEKVEVEVYDFSPIYAEGLIGWFDANDTATILNNNNFISKWLDKSDLKNNFYQDISNNMPVFSNNGIVFDGVNDSLELETTISESSISIIYIKKSSDTISLDFVGQSNSQYAFVSQSGSNSGLFHDFGTPQTYVNGELKNFANRSQVYDVVHNSQLNLVSIMHGNSSSWSEFKIGNYPSYEFSGSFYEIIFLQGLVSFDTRSRIEGYLAHKWGLTSNLASNHPFKNKAP